ncbi:MAG: nicotinamide riboside transporter PnuC [Bacteroidales bacterium]
MMVVWDWLAGNYFELAAALLGVVSIFLQIKQNHFYWLVALVMVSMYIYVYYESKFYADMSLQIYYVIVSIYGWLHWVFGNKKRKKNGDGKKLPVSKLKRKEWLLSIAASIMLFFVIWYILDKFTDSPVPIGDAFTTSLSFVATWMLARKLIENWLFWIVVDVVATGLYIYKGLYPTAALFLFLTVMAFIGYFAWRKDLKKTQNA